MLDAKPVILWIGEKRRLALQVLSNFGQHTCYGEAFAGAAAIYFAKEPSDVEVLNDVNGDLINLHRVIRHHLVESIRQFRWAL